MLKTLRIEFLNISTKPGDIDFLIRRELKKESK
jgi:hypothetical protein